ncbi:conserved Plasmodium protein, unknown function [Plasmodium ovale wallikeri]|uniref:Uncharacterized protein n=2 Tax=Plasmodium ovale TaxID=36330 RepID=A0A1A8YQS4_PLAOA|nr:conserved Plasmodium protein, unknown function [Plasmodium ovale wallikeri]SBT34489.1 conserved Plasmodium protein, unknown function [Plasmodium ovale wallikeri]SBT76623.1 conserved Plasmodium protein, unknown function [Plasmodium ovale]
MKIEDNNNLSDPFSASQVIGDKLLQGWTLLNATCHICKVTPLVKQKNKEENFCAKCNLYIKFEKKENEETDGERSMDISIANSKFDEPKKEETSTESPIKYIKEIKLQNEEFNDLLNKNNITNEEIKNLFEYKNYIKERCGYDVGTWLDFDPNFAKSVQLEEKREHGDDTISQKGKNGVLQNEQTAISQRGVHFSEKHTDTHCLRNKREHLKISEENYFLKTEALSSRYNKLETEFLILNKAKDVFLEKLEKYIELLGRRDNKNEEMEYINKVVSIVGVLEKINNLKKYVIL